MTPGAARPRTVAYIIARLGSTRVPGKAIADIAGLPMIARMIGITRQIRQIDDFAALVPATASDDPLAETARAHGAKVLRGHPDYVLDRIHQANEELDGEVIVYVGGDCPLLDPAVIDRGIEVFFARGCDYLNNYDPPTFPEGMDVNVLTRAALDAAFARALAPSQRIHAFSYLTRHPEAFSVSNFENEKDLSHHHWSVDFPEDLEFVHAVYSRLGASRAAVHMDEVLSLISRDPDIAALDRKLQRGPVAHAFWNSPGIMRDMRDDVAHLTQREQAALRDGDANLAGACRHEIALLNAEIARFEAAYASHAARNTMSK